MINDKTIAYLLKRRRDNIIRFYRTYPVEDYDDPIGRDILRGAVSQENNQKFPLPKGITDEDYDKYQPFMMNSYECGYIGKDGNITDEGMFDLEDD